MSKLALSEPAPSEPPLAPVPAAPLVTTAPLAPAAASVLADVQQPGTLPAPKRPRRSVTREARPARSAAHVPAPAASSRLLDEVRLLDRVRSLLARGDGSAALAALTGYDRTFAAGELALEARVLRVAGEFGVGHADAARALASELLATPGTERYRNELRRLMAKQSLEQR